MDQMGGYAQVIVISSASYKQDFRCYEFARFPRYVSLQNITQKRGGPAPASLLNLNRMKPTGLVPATAKESEDTERTKKRGGGLGDGI
jgi:hypothetical protein